MIILFLFIFLVAKRRHTVRISEIIFFNDFIPFYFNYFFHGTVFGPQTGLPLLKHIFFGYKWNEGVFSLFWRLAIGWLSGEILASISIGTTSYWWKKYLRQKSFHLYPKKICFNSSTDIILTKLEKCAKHFLKYVHGNLAEIQNSKIT